MLKSHKPDNLQDANKLVEQMGAVVQHFSQLLAEEKSIEELLWDVAQNCIPKLGLVDCVIYLLDEENGILKQVAAYGEKSPDGQQIIAPIDIPLGSGIVGTCALLKKSQLVADTRNDERYIVDDAMRLSELAAPIIVQDNILGVIDSEHPEKNFFQPGHLHLLNIVASLCGSKMMELQTRDLKIKAEKLKQQARRLQELDHWKTTFISNISHDLKTPLTLILDPAQQISLSSKEHDTRNMARMIRKNAEHLLRMVNQLLELNKLEFMIQKLNVQKIQISPILRGWTMHYMNEFDRKNLELFLDIPDEIEIFCDIEKLEKIFHNLFQNSIKFTSSGQISVSVSANEEWFILSINDTGTGIAPEFQERIFERFFKLDDVNAAHEGTGIGLALVKELTLVMGGKVELNSIPGEGSEFIVKIPQKYLQRFFKNENLINVSDLMIEEEEEEKPIVLLVEDHEDIRSYLAQSLKNSVRIIEAANGEAGLALALEYLPDLVITDLMMPVMTGEEMILKLRKHERTDHIPVIALTAKNNDADRIKLYEIGVDNYIVKPFNMQTLRTIVQKTISQRKRLIDKFQSDFFMPDGQEDTDKPFLDKIIKLIMLNIDVAEFGVTELQREFGLNRNQLQRKLKALTGVTPVEFIRQVRLKTARKMLAEGQYNVSEVAYQVGFNNLSYFTRTFRQHFGDIPSAYIPNN